MEVTMEQTERVPGSPIGGHGACGETVYYSFMGEANEFCDGRV